jgi:uncharacterized repeat protein (TIGR03803 family)
MKAILTSMKTQLTILHNGSRTCAMTKPVSRRKPVLALLIRLLWAAALVLPAFGVQAAVVLTTLHSFELGPNGANPYAGLVQGSDGNFYGMTSSGGAYNSGAVFKINPNGALTRLYSFTGGKDGANPYAGLVQGSDSNFYGTTEYGGTNNAGTAFKISATGALTTLYSFTGSSDGVNPTAGLIQASDGSLYGIASGGAYYGTIFRITTNGAFTLIYSFTGADDGAYPEAALIQASDGYLYGTASAGGSSGLGTVFRVSVNGDFNSLFSFDDTDGSAPVAALLQAADGYLYGTTSSGSGRSSAGTVFRISTNGAFNSLHLFTGGNDGGEPNASLMQASDGNLYGTTSGGGANGYGTVFKISTNGALTSLYSFTGGNDGANPQCALVQGTDGNLYGTTVHNDYFGGSLFEGFFVGTGTVFQTSTNGALTTLYSFTGGGADGANPAAGLVQGSDGSFYGTTANGGNFQARYSSHSRYFISFGTVFQISTDGALTTLYSFGGTNGASPNGLVQGTDGNLYGTTAGGDTEGSGTVFKINTNRALTTLYAFDTSFPAAALGRNPQAGLVQGSDGNFYGTTYSGGTNGEGNVFKISTNGELTSLYSFGSGSDGMFPQAGLVQGSDGNFYGTTYYGGTNVEYPFSLAYGTVFQISTSGALTTLYSFAEGNDGGYPSAGLVQGSDGNFYGTTEYGGTYGYGTVFQISTTGALTSLYSFTGTNDGANPVAGLVQGSDGNFYGTTSVGGTFGSAVGGYGTVFKISTSGALTSLYSFTGTNDGANPQAGLVQSSDGSFYGTTYNGGVVGAGTAFRLTVVPEFQAVTVTNGTLSLTWSTEAGGTYQLQYNSDLTSSNWTNLGSAVTAAGATLSGTDSVTNAPQRFYRLVISP